MSLNKQFPQVFNGQLFFTNTTATDDRLRKLRGRDAGVQLRRRRRLQPPVPAEQFRDLRAGRLEGHCEPDAEPGTAHGIPGSMDGRGLPHRQHRVGPDEVGDVSVYLSELRQQAWGFRTDGERGGIDVQEQRFDGMGTARWIRVGPGGTSHDDGARGLRHLLRARGRGRGGPVELPVAVHPDRVFRTDAGIHDVGLLSRARRRRIRTRCPRPDSCQGRGCLAWRN